MTVREFEGWQVRRFEKKLTVADYWGVAERQCIRPLTGRSEVRILPPQIFLKEPYVEVCISTLYPINER
jgi:hypothetical protein